MAGLWLVVTHRSKSQGKCH